MTLNLDPLVRPRSIAFVGASERQGTPGYGLVESIRRVGFPGEVWPVNPRYDTVQDIPCFGSLAELPEAPDLVALGISSTRMEEQLRAAIDAGARSAVIFDSCCLEGDTEPRLVERLRDMAKEANLPVCGGNGMGLMNLAERAAVTTYDVSHKFRPGGDIAFVTHSGTVFTEIGFNDPRFTCHLVVSCGQEINGTMADYVDYALDMPQTRTVGLFMETARDPERFRAALAKARAKDVAVVVLKVGRTAEAARFARTHSGALVGDDDAYQAVFDAEGALRVESLEDMANLLTLLSDERRPAAGGIAAMLDSGGEREMLVDMADAAGVPFARLSDATMDRLRTRLDHSLVASNPLDAWAREDNYEDDFEDHLTAMAEDPDTAIAMYCGDMTWNTGLDEGYPRVLDRARRRTAKPVMALVNMPTSDYMQCAMELK